jgi:ankyrin repeat protein
VKLLLDEGADANPEGWVYNNPLYAVSQEGHEQVMKLLLARGSNTQDVPLLSQPAFPDRSRQQLRKSSFPNNTCKYCFVIVRTLFFATISCCSHTIK